MDLTGQKLGKYDLVERLGLGGMAEVYKAFQPGVERFVAIKVMHPHLAESDDFVTRFQREAKAVGQLQHTHIMRIIDFDIQNDNYYMVMEFIDGEDLEGYLKRVEGAMPASLALRITDELAGALAYAHKRGMIHRDIKPANIMSQGDKFDNAVLMDFGIARLAQEGKMTMTGSMVGTPAYMSPEAVQGENVDERTDIYSLGVVLYEMVTGRTPYVSDTPYGLIAKQMKDPIPEPREFEPSVPDELNQVLMKALAKNADKRYQSATEFQTALRHARMALGDISAVQVIDATRLGSQKSQIAPTKEVKKQAGKSKKLPLIAAGVAVLAIAFIFVFILLSFGEDDDNTTISIGISITTPTVVGASTATPEPLPTQLPPTEALPTVVLPTSEPVATPEPVLEPVSIPAGFLQFSDNSNTRAGTFDLTLARVPLLPPNAEYVFKIRPSSDAPSVVELGAFGVEDDNTATLVFETGDNLFTDFAVFEVNMVQDGVETPVFIGLQDIAFVTALRDLLFEGRGKGLLLGIEEQAVIARDHAGFLFASLEDGDLAEAKQHAEHLVNILDGADGADFGDLNGDSQAQNPGDGVGIRVYLAESQTIVSDTFEAYGGQGRGDVLQVTLTHMEDVRRLAQETALKVFATDTATEALPFAQTLQFLMEALLTGADVSEDGVIDPRLGEGGVLAAYQQGLAWGAVQMNPIDPNLLASGMQTTPSIGTFRVINFDGRLSNAFELAADGLLLPAENEVYEAWLVDNAGIPAEDLTELFFQDGSVLVVGSVEGNVIEDFSSVLIARQPAGGSVSNPTDIAYRADFPPGLLPQLRALLAEDGLFALASPQLDLVLQHGGLVLEALNEGNLDASKGHAEHVVNILVGTEGEQFGDLNRDGQSQNPGDGFGLNIYLLDIATTLDEIALAQTLSPSAQFATNRAVDTTLHHQDILNQVLSKALQIFATDTAEEATPIATDLVLLITEVKNGADLNEDGVVDPLLLEGGVDAVYRFTQKATLIELVAVE